MHNITGDSLDLTEVSAIIWEKLSEKDRLIMAIQKLWSIDSYLYTVQTTIGGYDAKYDYCQSRQPVCSLIDRLENELFNVSVLKRKYYESMARNQ